MPRTKPPSTAGFVAARLRELAQSRGGLNELARKAGISPSTLSRGSQGQAELSISTLVAVARACEVSLDWLVLGAVVGGPTPDSAGQIPIPFFRVEASAGPGRIAAENTPPDGEILLPAGVVALQGSIKLDDLCALLADGDSMEPTIGRGALLIIHKTRRILREGVHVLIRGDAILVKRLQMREKCGLRLISDNPKYEPEDVQFDDPHQALQIVGQVIWTGHAV
jgi:transcriptional regulator with XRE-family HTH domain